MLDEFDIHQVIQTDAAGVVPDYQRVQSIDRAPMESQGRAHVRQGLTVYWNSQSQAGGPTTVRHALAQVNVVDRVDRDGRIGQQAFHESFGWWHIVALGRTDQDHARNITLVGAVRRDYLAVEKVARHGGF